MDRQILSDRYRIEARIGQGGMAEVYRGFDPALDRTVAVKILLPPFDRDAGFVSRFRREAQAAARLNHPNIVGVYDAGADGDVQYIVMEYIEGRTLASFLAGGGRTTPLQAVEVSEKITEALRAAHAQGIVHRDIKPANVMVTREGEVKVMDFGIARLQTDATAPQTSSVIGTPAYFSPEQAQGHNVDARSDIYSLGCVLYELLAHQQPFTGDTPVAVAYKQVNETPVPPSQRNPDVPPRFDAVVMKCMAKNPANRYQSAGELLADLQRAREGQEVEATPLLPAGAAATQVIARQPTQVMSPPEPEGSSKKVWLGVLIGVIVVAILAGAGYLLAQILNDDGTAPPQSVFVEDVTGLSYPAAKAVLEGQGLIVDRKNKQTGEYPPDQVISQNPREGTEVDLGSTVVLTVAIPPKTVEVPNLYCMTPEEAQAALDELGLELGEKTTEESDQCAEGEIVSQDPAAGTAVVPRDEPFVNVTIASGPAPVVVGDYTCKTFNAAKNAAEKDGLSVTYGGTVPTLPQCPNPNFVADQDLDPGDQVEEGTTITLWTGELVEPTATPEP